MKKYIYPLILLTACMAASCSEEGPDKNEDSKGIALDNGTAPDFDTTLSGWNGETATDGDKDVVGSDDKVYHELTNFRYTVNVSYAGNTASVESNNPRIKSYVEGAYVTVDFQTYSVSDVEIIVKGKTEDGGLKIYGGSKFKLTLDNADITSKRGPAINDQCKKRVFIALAEGSTNRLADCAEYVDDHYYRPGSPAELEDRKGCLFTEGNTVFSGKGTLEVKGLYRHGIATDGYLIVRPGVTIAVTEAAKNCFNVKGDLEDGIGVLVKGGYIYAMTSATAGRSMKTDEHIVVEGGTLVLNASGDAGYDAEDGDTSSPACLKAAKNVSIYGGELALRTSGKGAKAINAGETLAITDGTVSASCTGERYSHSDELTSSSKALKATKTIEISGGKIIAISTGASDGSRAIESDLNLNIKGGDIDAYSYDDAVNAPNVWIEGETELRAYSISADGIQGKESLTIEDGNITAVSGSAPAQALKCNAGSTSSYTLRGGRVLAFGGGQPETPKMAGVPYGIADDFTADKGSVLTVTDGTSAIFTFTMPRTVKDGSILVAYKALPTGGIFDVLDGGKSCID